MRSVANERWLRTFIRVACAPIKNAPPFSPPWDKNREVFRYRALREFGAGRPSAYRTWLDTTFPKWRHSPTAQMLRGLSHFYEEDLEAAARHYDEAERLWLAMRDMGELDDEHAAWILNGLAGNRALLFRSAGEPERAHAVLWEAVEATLPEGEPASEPIQIAARTLWINLLRLATIEKNSDWAEDTLRAMLQRSPRFVTDPWLCRLLAEAGELAFVRDLTSWAEFERAIAHAPGVERVEGSAGTESSRDVETDRVEEPEGVSGPGEERALAPANV